MIRRVYHAVISGAGLALAISLVACAGDDCLALAHKRCECCAADQIETCKAAMDQQAERSAPTELELARCSDDLKTFTGCGQIPKNELDPLCALKPDP